MEAVGDRIRALRLSKKFTQEQLGEAIGAGTPGSAKAMIAKIEGGQEPGGRRLRRLTEALGCSGDLLLTGRSRDLMELIRFYVPVPESMDAPASSVFRAARLFLYFAIRSSQTDPGSEYMDVANRLFYMAAHAPTACVAMLRQKGNKADSAAEREDGADSGEADLPERLREWIDRHGDSKEMSDYVDYKFAYEAAKRVLTHYIKPDAPPAPETRTPQSSVLAVAGAGHAGETVQTAHVTDDSLAPLARRGQQALLADEARLPHPGDLVGCVLKDGNVTFGRLAEMNADTVSLHPVAPGPGEALALRREHLASLRVVRGILYE